MRKIKLTKGKFAIVDDSDFRWLNRWRWQVNTKGYAIHIHYIRMINGKQENKTISMHRIILNAPKNKQVDHINHNILDNRRNNLRLCTSSQNSMNRKPLSLTGLKGIYKKSKNRWGAEINTGDTRIFLGSFISPIDAANAYEKASRKLFGEFAYQGGALC